MTQRRKLLAVALATDENEMRHFVADLADDLEVSKRTVYEVITPSSGTIHLRSDTRSQIEDRIDGYIDEQFDKLGITKAAVLAGGPHVKAA